LRTFSPTEPDLTGKIVEWDHQKGYGFLLAGKRRVFLHRREFVDHHRKPAVGDAIRFMIGKDALGRICATNATHVNDGGRITVLNVMALASLLALPAIAVQRRTSDFHWVGAYLLGLCAITYWAYAMDKRRARNKEWRLSEQRLHLLELLGGWPAAFLAQRQLRHKCSKRSFQFAFWLIVFAYQFAAFDSLQNWQLSRTALKQLQNEPSHRR
jgi:uncharacterized membrane protein YsdA (DUF1294 family)/cold shock CspA family protein